MYQLVYISTARPGLIPAAVDAILAGSRHNNRRDGITGLLVHDGKRFLQVLEGTAPLVDAAFARIKADPRHCAAVMLSARDVEGRQFGEWDMACQVVAPTRDGGTLGDTVDAMVAGCAEKNLQAQFSSFARVRQKAA